MLEMREFFPVPIRPSSPAVPATGDMWRDSARNILMRYDGTKWDEVPELMAEQQHITAIYRDGQIVYEMVHQIENPGDVITEGLVAGNHGAAGQHVIVSNVTVNLVRGHTYDFSVYGNPVNHGGGSMRMDAWMPGKTPANTAYPGMTSITGDHHIPITIPAAGTPAGQYGTTQSFTATESGAYTITLIVDDQPFDNFIWRLSTNDHRQTGLQSEERRILTGIRTDLAKITTTEIKYQLIITGYFMKHPIGHYGNQPVTVIKDSPDNGVPSKTPIPADTWTGVMDVIGVQATARGATPIQGAVTIDAKIAGRCSILIVAYPKGTNIDRTDILKGRIVPVRESGNNGAVGVGSDAIVPGINSIRSSIDIDYSGDIEVHTYIRYATLAGQEIKVVEPGWALDILTVPQGIVHPLTPYAEVYRPVIELEGRGHSGAAHVLYSDITKAIRAPVTVETQFNSSPPRTYTMENPFDQTFEAPLGERIDRVVIDGRPYTVIT